MSGPQPGRSRRRVRLRLRVNAAEIGPRIRAPSDREADVERGMVFAGGPDAVADRIIDRPLDMCRSAVNTIGNLAGAVYIDRARRAERIVERVA